MTRASSFASSALAAGALFLFVAACSSSQGGVGQACYGNGTCNAGLTCLSKLCVDANPDGGTGQDSGSGNPDSGGVNPDGGAPDSGNMPDAGPPAPPTLGAPIDRVGRPGINILLNDRFDSSTPTRNADDDSYNAATPANWASFQSKITPSLGLFDGLDGTCENQLFAARPATSSSYQTLGTLLVDDRLYVNTASTTCSTYLGVELNGLGAMTNTDCGGLTPLTNAIDATYSLLIVGTLNGASNGITTNDASSSSTVFPYLASPH